ncbi:MAG: hydantoinase/oxoprolinase family protein, partial [Halobacteria archaeon]|nr:hydantoinase/oxoprolinase family protein [Halobacteria archaeon]
LLSKLLDGHSPDDVDRVVVSTTLVLNAALQNRLPATTNIVVPGVGLGPSNAFYGDENIVAEGCIDHRGRVIDEVSLESEPEPSNPVVALTAKFSTRNPALEQDIRTRLDYADDHVSMGHEAGGRLGFPKRASTTVFNASSKPLFHDFEEMVSDALADMGIDVSEDSVFYLKGDAAMLSQKAVLATPSHTLRSGPAASSLGLVALSGAGVENALCVDIGGTTTDITVVEEGFPHIKEGFRLGEMDIFVDEESPEQKDLETFYEGVRSVDLPIGGDTLIDEDGLQRRREGNSAAFGGEYPTPTDAFNVLDYSELGDVEASHDALSRLGDPEEVAREVIDEFVSEVSDGIERLIFDSPTSKPDKLVAGGVLAPQLIERIADSVGIGDTVVPEHADVCGAVGCAAA